MLAIGHSCQSYYVLHKTQNPGLLPQVLHLLNFLTGGLLSLHFRIEGRKSLHFISWGFRGIKKEGQRKGRKREREEKKEREN